MDHIPWYVPEGVVLSHEALQSMLAQLDLPLRSNEQLTWFFETALPGSLQQLQALLRAQPELATVQEPYGKLTPLHRISRICTSTCIPKLQLLLDFGANIEADEWFSHTPLHHCAYSNNVDGALFLLQRGADPDHTNSAGRTARDMAVDAELHDFVAVHDAYLAAQVAHRTLGSVDGLMADGPQEL